MSKEDGKPGDPGTLRDLFHNPHPPETVVSPPPPHPKKRRRKGQLNDGEWAPGYGPNAKKEKR